MKALTGWLARMRKRRTTCPALPGARFVRPEIWTKADKENFDQFLKTSSGTKFLLTLHALVTDRSLSVIDRTPYEHGMTGGMSFLLDEIERLAVEGETEDVREL